MVSTKSFLCQALAVTCLEVVGPRPAAAGEDPLERGVDGPVDAGGEQRGDAVVLQDDQAVLGPCH